MATKKMKSLLHTAGSTAYVGYDYADSEEEARKDDPCYVHVVLAIRNARTYARANKAIDRWLKQNKIYSLVNGDSVNVTFFLYEAFKYGSMADRVFEIDADTGAMIR
jgi:hypothetical protein